MAYGARTNGVAGHTSRHADMHLNRDGPPPSTLAAQIVHNQTRPPATQSNGEQATFAGLLHELLHNSDAAPETDVAVNVQLIAVVVKAGLSVLTHDNPFARWEELHSQAGDSLKVVKATITRQPEVLVTPIQPDGPQLLLWLIVRLLPICGNPRCQDLLLTDLLIAAITALEKSTKLWRATEIMQDLIRSCVDDAIIALESSDGSMARLAVVLPPMRWLTKLWPKSETAIALPQDAQVVIDNSMQVILMSLTLSRSIKSHPRWLDETCQRLHALLLREPPRSRRTDTWRGAIVGTLELSRGASQLPILAELLTDSVQILPSQAMQRGIAEVLRDVLQAGLPQYVQYLEEPMLKLVRGDPFQQLDPSFKSVVTQGVLREVSSADVPNSLRDADQDMVDIDAPQQHRSPAQGADLSRARKRRRVRPQQGQHQKEPMLSRLADILASDLNDLPSLVTRAPAGYGGLDLSDQCAVWVLLNEILRQAESSNDYVPLFASLLDALELQNTKKPRILCMQAIHTCVRKSTDATTIDLAASRFGRVTLRALHSSLRELRIAAAHCLPAFLHIDLVPELFARNQQIILQYLRTLSDRDVPSELETLIVAWGQVAT
ncbi:serine/threonine-protein kinase M1, partial [Oleoguttula sp. CCFEE 5521]